MQEQKLALSLLFLAVVVSGCADGGEGKVSGEAISVTGPTVQPSEIREGASVQASISAENTGEVSSNIMVGDNGREVLTDYCTDFFTVNNFQASSSRDSETSNEYELNPGERVQMNWELDQEGVSVPLNGYSCPLKFQIPFDYSVQSYYQLQIKQEDTETEVELSSQSSQGPLSIGIETLGSSSRSGAPIFLEGDNPEALIQIVNEQPEDSVFRGVMRVTNLEIEATGVELGEGCKNIDETITIDRNQMSDIIRCEINYDLDGSSSKRGEISAAADYTYVKNIGSRTVEVKYSGN